MKPSGIDDKDLGTLSRSWYDFIGRVSQGDVSSKSALACLEQMVAGKAAEMLDTHRRLFDCDAPAHIQEGWSIPEEEQPSGGVRGKIYFDPTKIILRPLNDLVPGGLSAVVLDHLLARKDLIPETWLKGGRKVAFPATVYRVNGDALYRVLGFSPSTCGYSSGFVPTDYVDRDGQYVAAHLTV